MTNREVAVRIMHLLAECGFEAIASVATPHNTEVGIVTAIDPDEKRQHVILVDYTAGH